MLMHSAKWRYWWLSSKANIPSCHCPSGSAWRGVKHCMNETLRKGKHALGALNLQIPCSQQHWTFWVSGLIAGNSSRHGQTKGLTVPATGSYHNCSSDPPDTPGGTVKLSCCPSGTVTDNVCPLLTPAGIAICKTCPAVYIEYTWGLFLISTHCKEPWSWRQNPIFFMVSVPAEHSFLEFQQWPAHLYNICVSLPSSQHPASLLQVRLVRRLLELGVRPKEGCQEGCGPHQLPGIDEAPNTKGPGCGDRSAHGSTTWKVWNLKGEKWWK